MRNTAKIQTKKATKQMVEKLYDNYYKIMDEAAYGQNHIIITKNYDNPDALDHYNFMNCDDEEVTTYMQYSPETVHYLARTLLTGRIQSLTVYDFVEFFSYPILVLAVKSALKKLDNNEFHIEFAGLEVSLPADVYEMIEPLRFNITNCEELLEKLELIYALVSFNQKTGIKIEVLDVIHEALSYMYLFI